MDSYTVQKGDTLGAIAKRLGLTVAELVRLNRDKIKDPNKIREGWTLKLRDAPPPSPPKQSGGPIKGKGGRGYILNYAEAGQPDEKIEKINPTSKFGRPASAVLKEKEWREGEEIKPEVKTPVEIAVIQPPAPPPPPKPAPKFGDTVFGKAHSYLDPVAVLSGNAGNPDFKPSAADYASTALWGLGGGSPKAQTLGITPRPPTPMAGTARDYAASQAAARGAPLDPNSPLQPTPAQVRRLNAAIKQRTKSGKAFDPGIDTNWGQPNVRTPEPVMPDPAKLSDRVPVGARERTVEAPKPIVVRAQDMKSWKDWRDSLRSASDNTVIIDGASDMGFLSDRVIITRGKGVGNKLDPEKVLDSFDPPVVTQAMFARILKHIGVK